MDSEAFRKACSQFASGVTIATVMGDDGSPHGLTASSFTSVSMRPPMVLVCVDHKASVHAQFKGARAFAINLLSEDQKDLSVRFSTPGGHRFSSLNWSPGKLGAPILREALAWFECEVDQMVEAGDHTIFIGRVKETASHEGWPLLYFNRHYRQLER
jgi:flavin reductase (DIM6/NTAB) family NADH-FMN oxidoreductase RutF